MISFECAVCGRVFNERRTIQLHIKRSHGEHKFECKYCGNKFSLNYNLTRHLRSHKAELQINTFECAACGKIFNKRRTIQLHIKRSHGKPKFECKYCGNKFSLNYNLTRHLRSHKANETTTLQIDTFECAICEKKFKKRNLLQKHISRTHGENKFECYHCGNKFTLKHHLTRHLHSHETPRAEHSHSYKCGFCFSCFRSKKEIMRHFENDYKITFRSKRLHFNSEEDFKKFKLDYQRRTVTQFIVRSSWKRPDGKSKLYKCHLSGLYKAKEGFEKFPKMNDLKKIQSYCPAEMYVKLFENGECVVDFQESHVGHNVSHNVGDPSELQYIYSDSNEREQIAAKIQFGVLENTICVDQVLTGQENAEGNQLRVLRNQEICEVAESYGIQNQYVLAFGDDLIDVDAFVKIHATSILYYKKQFEDDTRFNVLANDDFALVFMNEFQEKNLCRYGKNIIAFDSTQNIKKYDFTLHTLLFVDINYEGVPAAFVISNRNDVTIINIFLRCIRDRVGTLTPQVIMGDMQLTYKNSWVKIMRTVPEFTFWCTWHVRDAWRKNYCKIFDKRKREEVKQMILDLAYESNPVLFHCKLGTFLSMDDVDLESFIAYFRRYYVENENSQMWAYCYRKEASINTIMSLESFHRSFKYSYGERKKMNWLSCIFFCVHQYLSVEKITEEMPFYVEVRANKLNMLRQKHYEAWKKEDITSKIHAINPNLWLVESFEKPDVMYVVERRSTRECDQYDDVICGIFCDFCKCCFHEYSCNCPDAVVCNNMCKHIHAVGILQNSSKTYTANHSDEDNSVAVMTTL